MAGIPDHVIEQIRERTDLAELVGRYVTLRRAGLRLVGLCPFHSEKSPSFTVHPDKQFFHCFGCQAHGDVYAFRMRAESLDFPEAARVLAREAGIVIPEGEPGAAGLAESLRRLHGVAHEFFRERLRSSEGAAARAYLERRGTPSDVVERFELGFAPAGWDGLVAELGHRRESLELAERAGLIAARQHSAGHYDRFRGRLIFPICDPGGRAIAFGGRTLGDDKPKYLNSTENPIYRKGRVLFGLHLALAAIRKRERAVLVEGYFDAIALHRAGIGEAVAPCGTALTREQVQMLRRYAREVVLLFDGDAAGQSAAERALPLLLSEGMRVRAAFLPSGEDPDTLLGRAGPDALRERIEQAVPFLDHRIAQLLGMQRAHAWDAADRVREIAPYLNAIPDAVELGSYVQRVASALELTPAAVAEAVRRAAGPIRAPLAEAAAEPPASALRPAARPPLDLLVRTLLESLLAYPQLVEVLDTAPSPFELSWVAEVSTRELLGELLQVLRERGERAPAWIFGPGGPPALADALAGLAAAQRFRSVSEAEQALFDCARALERQALSRRSDEIRARLESCSDVRENERLFEELAELHHRRGRLDRQRRDERGRTRILSPSP